MHRPRNETALDRVSAAAQRAVDDERLVGATIRVVHRGELVHRSAHGAADREADRPFAPEQRVRLASITKPIVTASILRLVEEGTLALDTSVTSLLPSCRPALHDGTTPSLSLRQLLTHTAGLSYPFAEPTDGPYHAAGVSSGFDTEAITMDEQVRRIGDAGLLHHPGSAWAYSVGLDLAGAMVEAATGEPLPRVVATLVSEPLGLDSLAFSVGDLTELAVPYADGPPPVRMGARHEVPFIPGCAPLVFAPARAADPDAFPSGGAGMVGDADDIATFLEAIRTGGGGIVGPELATAMMTNQIGDLRTDPTGAWAFGFGGAVLADPAAAGAVQSRGTWSWGGVWGHTWWVDPTEELTVVALTNTAVEGMAGTFTTDLARAVYEALELRTGGPAPRP